MPSPPVWLPRPVLPSARAWDYGSTASFARTPFVTLERAPVTDGVPGSSGVRLPMGDGLERRVERLEEKVTTVTSEVALLRQEQGYVREQLTELKKATDKLLVGMAELKGAVSVARFFGFTGVAVIAAAVVLVGLKALGH